MAATCLYSWAGRWSVRPELNPDDTGHDDPEGPVTVGHVCIAVDGHIGRHRCHCGLRSSSGVVAPDPVVAVDLTPADLTLLRKQLWTTALDAKLLAAQESLERGDWLLGVAADGSEVRHAEPPVLEEQVFSRPPRRAEQGEICDWHPGLGVKLGSVCEGCGHATLAHVGTDECPVCVLIWHSTTTWLRQQARLHGARWPV